MRANYRVSSLPGNEVSRLRCAALDMTRVVVAVVVLLIAIYPLRVSAQKNAAARYEIDAKRIGVSLESEDALPRSREFIRIDSTYYVGWLYEGAYKFNHAVDYLGFKNAAVPLERARRLMERDFRKQLSTRTQDLATYFPVYNYHIDYAQIAMRLNTCYTNTDEPEKVWAVLDRYARFNFQKDYFDAYNHMMWVVHRNRFYTGAKYSFLKNGIDANERLADSLLNYNLNKIRRFVSFNSSIFIPGSEEQEILGVYHYKAVLHSYAFNIDSAEWYYKKLRDGGQPTHNNYATFKTTIGDFKTAYEEYSKARATDFTDKRLQEWAYYTALLDIYRAKPKVAAQLSRDMIKSAGSTPGFGWYNIALARALRYDGQVREAERMADKAAEFKEVHIGTTLGQSHYDFSVQMQKLLVRQARVEMPRFENRNWWYNPGVLARISGAIAERFLQQYLIVNQFAQNPERDRVIYALFSTESTIGWDEVWSLIGDFSTNFFLDRFEKELRENKRPGIAKYFQYFIARLRMKKGDYREARTILSTILADPRLDKEYERLFIARCHEALALCADELDDKATQAEHLYRLTTVYPQLVPFTGQQAAMKLSVSGEVDQKVVDRLLACNVEWTPEANIPAPRAFVVFTGAAGDGRGRIEYWVEDAVGAPVIPRQRCTYELAKSDAAGVSMAYRLFGIGGTDPENVVEELRSTEGAETPEERSGI